MFKIFIWTKTAEMQEDTLKGEGRQLPLKYRYFVQ